MRLNNLDTEHTFLIADLHFYHRGVFRFDPVAKTLFNDSVEERVEKTIKEWNTIITPTDTVLVLGDVCFRDNRLHVFQRLNGVKYLVRGNHDTAPEEKYLLNGFQKVTDSIEYDRILFSHFPVHPCQLVSRYRANVHGHLHDEVIHDTRYANVCMETRNYKPVKLSEVLKELGE